VAFQSPTGLKEHFMTNRKPNDRAKTFARWAILLSGGNHARPRESGSLLEQTFDRAETLIPAQKLLVVVAREALQFDDVRRQLASRPRECIIVQPDNKDSGPGILLPLMYLRKRDPAAVVAIFPSDHSNLQDDLILQHVERAFKVVESDGSRIVLLGAEEPKEPDTERNYILPGESSDSGGLDGGRMVEMFVQKPSPDAARIIISKGALWNTQILVVKCETLLQAIELAAPEMYRSFAAIQDAIGTAEEKGVVEKVYQALPAVNFFNGVFELLPYENRQNLRVLPVHGVTRKGWGTGRHDHPQEDRLVAAKAI
jgi:mannose-1-phosphate guanylyltransferase